METVLFVAHTESDNSLGRAALEALTAAKLHVEQVPGAVLNIGIFGGDVGSSADALAGCGAARVFGVFGSDFAQSRYASDAFAIESLYRATNPAFVISGGSPRLNRVLPGVAARLGGYADLHATAMDAAAEGVSVTRWHYRQRIRAIVCRQERPWCISIDAGIYEAWQPTGTPPQIELLLVALPPACARTQVTGLQEPPGNTQTVRPDADLLFVAGAGWTKKQADGQAHTAEAEKIILETLANTKASLGGSKSLVDISGDGASVLSFMSHLNQVGQTGATPRHPKGLATCCHGEEPHVVGWRFVNERRAINLDANCGWAQGKADVVYVSDAFEVMKNVNRLLSS